MSKTTSSFAKFAQVCETCANGCKQMATSVVIACPAYVTKDDEHSTLVTDTREKVTPCSR